MQTTRTPRRFRQILFDAVTKSLVRLGIIVFCLPLGMGVLASYPKKIADRTGILTIFALSFIVTGPVFVGALQPIFDTLDDVLVEDLPSANDQLVSLVASVLILLLGYIVARRCRTVVGHVEALGVAASRASIAFAIASTALCATWQVLDGDRGSAISAIVGAGSVIRNADGATQDQIRAEFEALRFDRER